MSGNESDENLGSNRSGRSTGSRSSHGSNRTGVQPEEPALLGENHCGALFTLTRFGERQFVCFSTGGRCRRPNHGALLQQGQHGKVGRLYQLCRTTSNASVPGGYHLDGLYDSEITEENYAAVLEAQALENEADFGSFAQKPHVRRSFDDDEEEEAGKSHSFEEVEHPAQGQAEAPAKRSSRKSPESSKGRKEPQTRASSRKEAPPAEKPKAKSSKPKKKSPPPPPPPDYTSEEEEVEDVTPPPLRARTKASRSKPSPKRDDSSASDVSAPKRRHQTRSSRKTRAPASDSESTPPKREKKSRSKKEKKSKRSRGRGKHTSKKGRRRDPSPSSSDSSSESSSSESEDSYRSPSPPPKLKLKWHAVVYGRDGEMGVFRSRTEAFSIALDTSLTKSFLTKKEGWKWVHEQLTTPAPHPIPAPDPAPLRGDPDVPPVALSGRDKSVGNDDEIFGINIDVDTKELCRQLAPPGVSDKIAKNLSESVLDAVALPGKTIQSSAAEDTASDIRASLSELAALANQERQEDDVRRDLKWQSQSKNFLQGIKSTADLNETLSDVLQLRVETMANMVVAQRVALMSVNWDQAIIESWCSGGYFTVISREMLDKYISLLQHLVSLTTRFSWEVTKREIEYRTRKWALIRNNSPTRLMAMCRLCISLRDGAHSKWLSSELEGEKLAALTKLVESSRGRGGGAVSGDIHLCPKCDTTLHGAGNCPWTASGNNKARREGRAALLALAQGPNEDTPPANRRGGGARNGRNQPQGEAE